MPAVVAGGGERGKQISRAGKECCSRGIEPREGSWPRARPAGSTPPRRQRFDLDLFVRLLRVDDEGFVGLHVEQLVTDVLQRFEGKFLIFLNRESLFRPVPGVKEVRDRFG